MYLSGYLGSEHYIYAKVGCLLVMLYAKARKSVDKPKAIMPDCIAPRNLLHRTSRNIGDLQVFSHKKKIAPLAVNELLYKLWGIVATIHRNAM